MDGRRVLRTHQAYSALIHTIQSRGYLVQTYQMPFLPVERNVHPSYLIGYWAQ
jgi:hypothetical protein